MKDLFSLHRLSLTKSARTFAAAFALLASNWFAHADTFVAPPHLENVEASAANDIPLGQDEMRAQQIHSPSLFPALPTPYKGFRITAVAFRLAADGPDAGGSFDSFERVQLYLSTSSRPFPVGFVNETDLDQNNGPDKTLVFDESTTLGGTYPAGNAPSAFNVRFTLSQPYDYYPENGSLVLEIWKYPGGKIDSLDCCGTEMRFLFGRHDGTFLGSIGGGNVTEFTFEPVPEPTTVALVSFGAVLALAALQTRKKQKRQKGEL